MNGNWPKLPRTMTAGVLVAVVWLTASPLWAQQSSGRGVLDMANADWPYLLLGLCGATLGFMALLFLVKVIRASYNDAVALYRTGGKFRPMKSQATLLYPLVPSGPQFGRSLEFFAALGFEKEWQHDGLAGLHFGGAYFLLQDIDVPQWQQNQQITFEVADLDVYWEELQAKDLTHSFPGAKLRPPTQYPWAREIHVIDPGGVCWHVRQSGGRAWWPPPAND